MRAHLRSLGIGCLLLSAAAGAREITYDGVTISEKDCEYISSAPTAASFNRAMEVLSKRGKQSAPAQELRALQGVSTAIWVHDDLRTSLKQMNEYSEALVGTSAYVLVNRSHQDVLRGARRIGKVLNDDLKEFIRAMKAADPKNCQAPCLANLVQRMPSKVGIPKESDPVEFSKAAQLELRELNMYMKRSYSYYPGMQEEMYAVARQYQKKLYYWQMGIGAVCLGQPLSPPSRGRNGEWSSPDMDMTPRHDGSGGGEYWKTPEYENSTRASFPRHDGTGDGWRPHYEGTQR